MTMLQRNLYHTIVWRLLLDVASRGVFFVINILIARALSVSDFGFFAVAVSLSQVFYIFTDLGTHLELIKELGDRRRESQDHWLGFFQLKVFLFAASFAAFLISIPFAWKWDRVWLPLIAFVWMSSNSLLDFLQFVCNGLGRMDLARRLMVVHRGVMLASVAVPLIFFKTLEGVALGLLCGSLAGAFFSNLLFYRDVRPKDAWRWYWNEWKRILTISLPLGIGGAFGSWYLRIGMIVLGWTGTAVVAGEYAAAFRIFEITYIVPAAVMSIGVPHLAEALRLNRDVFFDELKKISRVMIAGGVCWGAFLFFLGPLIITVLYGDGFLASVPYLKILAVVGLMVFLNFVVTHIMVVIEKQMRHAVHQIVAFVACLAGSITATSSYGAKGVAFSLLAAEVTLFGLTTAYLIRFFSKKNRDLGFATIPPYAD